MDTSLSGVLPALGAGRGLTAGEAAGVGADRAGAATQTTAAGESFGDLLARALDDLNGAQQAADAGAVQLAAGAPVDLHQVMIGMEHANLSLGLALQVRNKLVEAYQEISRMPV
jgi:flagellar hook-basal body complex protein FliE